MTQGEYFKLIAKPVLLLSILPAGYGALMMMAGGHSFGMPVGLFMGLLTLLFTAVLTGVVLGVTALAIRQPTFRRALLFGFGLPLAAGALLWLAGAPFREAIPLLCLLLSPLLLGAGVLHGADGRRLLRWGGILLLSLLLPVVLFLPDWATPLRWNLRSLLAMPLLGTGLFGAWLHSRLPAARPPVRQRQERAAALILLLLSLAGVLILPGRLLDYRQAQAVATFRERHPEVQLTGQPRIRTGKWESFVELPADGWTYRVTLDGGKVVDDGYGQREAALTAADYLKRGGRSFNPIQSRHVYPYSPAFEERVPFPGAYQVSVEMTDGRSGFIRLLVYKGQVLSETHPGKVVLPGPRDAWQVAGLINQRTGRQGFGSTQPYDLLFAWQHEEGVWEYGYKNGATLGIALVKDGQLIDLKERLPIERWAPPH